MNEHIYNQKLNKNSFPLFELESALLVLDSYQLNNQSNSEFVLVR